MKLSGRARRWSLALLSVGTVACGGSPSPAPAPATPAPEPEPLPAPVVEAPATLVVTRVDTVTVRDPALDQRISRLELQLLERDAKLAQLEARLDEARREVVRAMAKLQTLATRAEAASAMAEAEVAVQSLSGTAGARGLQETGQAKRLLDMSSQEFNRQNYGGALYLATQAKGTAAGARGQLAEGGRGTARGETLLAAPLELQALGRTNVRAAPGTDAAILFTVERGVRVQALAHAGDWMRITDPSGRTGWIIRSRLGRPAEEGR